MLLFLLFLLSLFVAIIYYEERITYCYCHTIVSIVVICIIMMILIMVLVILVLVIFSTQQRDLPQTPQEELGIVVPAVCPPCGVCWMSWIRSAHGPLQGWRSMLMRRKPKMSNWDVSRYYLIVFLAVLQTGQDMSPWKSCRSTTCPGMQYRESSNVAP